MNNKSKPIFEDYPIGDKFLGEVSEGKKNGLGMYLFNDETKFVGEFQNNERNGIGMYYLNDGIILTGEWVDGKLSLS